MELWVALIIVVIILAVVGGGLMVYTRKPAGAAPATESSPAAPVTGPVTNAATPGAAALSEKEKAQYMDAKYVGKQGPMVIQEDGFPDLTGLWVLDTRLENGTMQPGTPLFVSRRPNAPKPHAYVLLPSQLYTSDPDPLQASYSLWLETPTKMTVNYPPEGKDSGSGTKVDDYSFMFPAPFFGPADGKLFGPQVFRRL